MNTDLVTDTKLTTALEGLAVEIGRREEMHARPPDYNVTFLFKQFFKQLLKLKQIFKQILSTTQKQNKNTCFFTNDHDNKGGMLRERSAATHCVILMVYFDVTNTCQEPFLTASTCPRNQ
jgi:hypothetical protein